MTGAEAGGAFTAPLSFAQERLWFLDRLEPGRPTYNIPLALRVGGPVATDAVAGALCDLAMRHEVLRTRFRAVDGEPFQVVAPTADVPLAVADLSHHPDAEREAVRRAGELARRPFDLAAGPLLRALLVRLPAGEHVLALTMHHVVADLWSTAVLARDLGALLDARRRGVPADLPELPIQYADFAVWQRRKLSGATLEALAGYWRDQLAGAPAEVTFPPDRPRPPSQSFLGETVPFAVPAATATALAALAREEGATLFMALLAAFDVVLGRYAGTDDVCVGTPIANRSRPEVEDLIGFFSNTLVLRTRFDHGATFRELLRQVRATTLDAYDHQDLPFEQLVAVVGAERAPNLPPLFQVLFGLLTTQHAAQVVDGDSDWGRISTGTAKFDATVLVRETTTGLEGAFEYATDLYDEATVRRILDDLVAVLAAVAEQPDRTVGDLAAAFRQPSPVDRAGPTVEVGAASPVEQFAAQVARAPDAVAVVAGATTWTYRDLDARSDGVARLLRSAGVVPGDRVGICLRPGPEVPAAVLGVLRAGAAYVPLDPAYPPDRLAFMGADAGLALVVTGPATAGLVPAAAGRQMVLDGAAVVGGPPPGPPPPRVRSGDVAYVIYTSGSTGRPKGVVMPHGVLANLTSWQAARSPATPRTLQLAPLSFDVSAQEMLSTWCAGGALVIAGEEARRDPAALLALARAERVERMFLPPALLQLVADVAAPDDWPATLREVITAGEALRITPAVRRALAGLRGAELVNQYGPSETHVVTEHRMAAADPALEDLPPIGHPVQNTTAHVLDARLGPVPDGARGELYVGGAAVAHGYHGRPDLTADRFVPDPFSTVPGARLYRTGDVVRRRADGALQFLGRVDDQVKVRGYRVEPGEVEAEMERLDGVRAAAVVGRCDHPGGPARLVAFVEAADGGATAGGGPAVRQALRSRLPAWMLPERVVFVDRLPLTPSGKVDRRALAGGDLAREDAPAGAVPPRTDLEAAVCAIWSEVLGVAPVGVRDSFFDLGGHSLAVARVAARVQERFGVEVPMRVLFDATTVEDLTLEVVLRCAMRADPAAVDALLAEAELRATAVATGV